MTTADGPTVRSPWIRRVPGAGPPRVRLLCVPHAGGGPTAFQGWRRCLPDDVELLIAHFPGRESRLAEAAGSDLNLTVGELARALAAEQSIVIFGHSLGAIIGLELARRIGDRVERLVVSGVAAPHCPRVLPDISHLPRSEFIAQLAALGGIPAPVLAHEGLMDALLPMLRADMRMAERIDLGPEPTIARPIMAVGGRQDPMTTVRTLAEWSAYTSSSFDLQLVEGDHFFHMSQQREVVDLVVRSIHGAAAP